MNKRAIIMVLLPSMDDREILRSSLEMRSACVFMCRAPNCTPSGSISTRRVTFLWIDLMKPRHRLAVHPTSDQDVRRKQRPVVLTRLLCSASQTPDRQEFSVFWKNGSLPRSMKTTLGRMAFLLYCLIAGMDLPGECCADDNHQSDQRLRITTFQSDTLSPVASVVDDHNEIGGPRDLLLSYHSGIDNTMQPYRLYLPSAYDGQRQLPLLIALHGTGSDQNKYFDHPAYHDGVYKKEAEKRGIMVVCPHGRGTTEYRGIGEHDVLTVLDEVCRRFLVDRDRVICSGQSMGGTGTTYLCCRHPDLFAGGVPLASTYGHVSLVENLRYVPMLYVQGEKDRLMYAQDGPIPMARRMNELGFRGRLWVVPGAGHNTMNVTTGDVLDWAIKQRRVKHPRRVTFRTYLPTQGQAYWTEIVEIAKVGHVAQIDAAIESRNLIAVSLKNAKRITLRPVPELLALTLPIRVVINDEQAFTGICSNKQEIRISWENSGWKGTIGERKVRPLTAYRTHKIGVVTVAPTQPRRWDTSGGKMTAIPQHRTEPPETSMGSWMADAMRSASGTEIAIYNRRFYRGIPLQENQDVYLVDLLNWLRPTNRCLYTFGVTGNILLEIFEDNIRNSESEDEFLLQVAGCSYEFDRNRPQGERIVKSDIEPNRNYTVVCESHMLSRGDTCFLAGHFGKLPYDELAITNVSAAWHFITMNDGQMEAKQDHRIRDVTLDR